MKTKFNFNSQICTTREQSERLLALGIKKETADMTIHIKNDDGWYVTAEPFYEWEDDMNTFPSLEVPEPILPAWSLGRLIEMMPLDAFPEGGFDNSFTLAKSYPRGYNVEYDGFSFYHKENIYDTLIEAIEHLIKEGYFNKEYLVWKRKAKFRK